MAFTGDRSALGKALRLVTAHTRHPRVTLHRSQSGGVVLLYADDDLYLRLPLPGELTGGDIAVQARALLRGLRQEKHPAVSLVCDPDDSIFLDGRSLHPALTPEPAPAFPRIDVRGRLHLPVANFRRMLREVVPFIGPDGAHPSLVGVHLEQAGEHLRLVASDGFRLAWSEAAVAGTAPIPARTLLSRSAALLLHRLLPARFPGDLRLEVAARHLRIFAGSAVVVTRLIPGEFPDYRLLECPIQRTLTLPAAPLRAAVKRLPSCALALHITPRRLVLRACQGGEPAEDLEADVVGQPLTFGLSRDYLLDVLRTAPGQQLTLSLGGAQEPCAISVPGRADCWFVIMPMALHS